MQDGGLPGHLVRDSPTSPPQSAQVAKCTVTVPTPAPVPAPTCARAPPASRSPVSPAAPAHLARWVPAPSRLPCPLSPPRQGLGTLPSQPSRASLCGF